MKTKIIIISLLFSVHFAFSQNSKEFVRLSQKADSLYKIKEYKKAGNIYNQAFKPYKKTIINSMFWYNSACNWALANEIDSSFTQLFYLAKKRSFNNYSDLVADTDLANLHSDKRWGKLLKIVTKNEKKLNKPLIAELDTIINDDQTDRVQAIELEKKYGAESAQAKEAWKKSEEKDVINQNKIVKIIDKYGWPDSSMIGDKVDNSLFLVIQHSNREMRLKYLPMMRKAVKKGNAKGNDLALLEDRTAIDSGKKQIYGSQLSMDTERQIPFFDVTSLIDKVNVDKKRDQIGLQPMSEYLKI